MRFSNYHLLFEKKDLVEYSIFYVLYSFDFAESDDSDYLPPPEDGDSDGSSEKVLLTYTYCSVCTKHI